jgi:hypothetical protein
VNAIPKVSDIWVPHATTSKHHYVKIFILGIEDMFEIKEKLTRVELTSCQSKLSCWSDDRHFEGEIKWNFEHKDGTSFSFIPTNVGSMEIDGIALQ